MAITTQQARSVSRTDRSRAVPAFRSLVRLVHEVGPGLLRDGPPGPDGLLHEAEIGAEILAFPEQLTEGQGSGVHAGLQAVRPPRPPTVWILRPRGGPGPFVLRRFLRVRRGLCPKCAYPIGESLVCTECGGALAKRARTP